MSAPGRAVRERLSGLPQPVVRRWQRSMLFRVVASTVVVGLATVVALGTYVTHEIRDGLVGASVDRILAESAQDAASRQEQLDNAPAVTPADLQALVNDLIRFLRTSGGGSRGVVILQHPLNTSDVPISSASSDAGLAQAVSADMRLAVQSGQQQSWQHVALADGRVPGVVVGVPLQIPEAGAYELYLVYSLAEEQATLALIKNVLTLGAIVLVALVVFMTWFVTLQVVRPVRQAARVASRLAEGLLSERMSVVGRDEMATLASTFNDMAESLQRQITRMEELSRLQRRFVADVSHELRTPLTTVRMASDVLHDARRGFPPEVGRSAELLNAQLDRFEALLGDLLEISRIDAGAAQLDFEDGDVLGLVQDEVAAIAPLGADRGVDIRLWSAAGDHTASVDRARVSRVVRNLLSNAIEHAQGNPVDVLVGSGRRAVAVVVRDYGLGLTPAQAERVFDRFWRADPSRSRSMGGTGLGLAIAREDAQLHGGHLEAWGSPGKGASFRLVLPRGNGGLGGRAPLPLAPSAEEFPELGDRVDVAAERAR